MQGNQTKKSRYSREVSENKAKEIQQELKNQAALRKNLENNNL